MRRAVDSPEYLRVFVFASVMLLFSSVYYFRKDRRKRVEAMFYGEDPGVADFSLMGLLRRITSPLFRLESMEQTGEYLRKAGISLSAEDFFAVRAVLGAVAGVLFSLLLAPDVSRMLMLGGLLGVLVFWLPRVYVRNLVARRQRSAAGEIQDYADLLTVAVEAGADVVRSLGLVCEKYGDSVLKEEFSTALHEIKGGKPINKALEDVAERLDVSEVSNIIEAVVQARNTGTPLSPVLRAQSSRIRSSAKFKYEEEAQKLPVKMMIPLFLLVMPSIFVIVLGPSLISLSKTL
ncbi:MAG: type II secretion system F family protein [Bacillota bacterium]